MAGQFPKNMRVPHRRTPVFVDDEGTPCAVASLMLQSGERNLVESVARIDNHLNIREVRAGPVIGWLEQEGLTKEEAARIQPSYSPALDLEIFATALFAVFLPLKIVGDAVWRKVTRIRQQAGAWAALGITIGVVFASVGIAVGAAVVLRPTTDTYAGIYRTALVLAFLLTLLPLELAALWALLQEGSHQVQRWRAVSPYLGLVNVGIAIVLAILIVPALVDFVG